MNKNKRAQLARRKQREKDAAEWRRFLADFDIAIEGLIAAARGFNAHLARLNAAARGETERP